MGSKVVENSSNVPSTKNFSFDVCCGKPKKSSCVKTFFNATGRCGKNSLEYLIYNPLKDSTFHFVGWPVKYALFKVRHPLKSFDHPEFFVEKKERITTREGKELIVPKYEYSLEEVKKNLNRSAYNEPGFVANHLTYQVEISLLRPLSFIVTDVVVVSAKIVAAFATGVFDKIVNVRNSTYYFIESRIELPVLEYRSDVALKEASQDWDTLKDTVPPSNETISEEDEEGPVDEEMEEKTPSQESAALQNKKNDLKREKLILREEKFITYAIKEANRFKQSSESYLETFKSDKKQEDENISDELKKISDKKEKIKEFKSEFTTFLEKSLFMTLNKQLETAQETYNKIMQVFFPSEVKKEKENSDQVDCSQDNDDELEKEYNSLCKKIPALFKKAEKELYVQEKRFSSPEKRAKLFYEKALKNEKEADALKTKLNNYKETGEIEDDEAD